MFKTKRYLFLCLVLVLCCVLVFGCGKNNSTKEPDPDPVELEPGIPLTENFDEATVDNFFTAGYKALPNDPEAPMYRKAGGTIELNEGYMVIKGGRFTVGEKEPYVETAGTDTEVNGDLDLSKPYKISFKISEAVAIIDPEKNHSLQVYVDNNGTSDKNSTHGSSSRIYNNKTSETLIVGDIVTIESDIGTQNSFIQIRIESGGSIGIDDLKIEYQE